MTPAPPNPPPARTKQHLVGLDGLRAIAAVSVMADHTAVHLRGIDASGGVYKVMTYGSEGLTLFFAISGFLLYLPFVAAVLDERPFPSVRRYFSNRGLRIFPGYLAIYVLVAWVIGAANTVGTAELFPHTVGRVTDPGRWVPDLFLVQSFVPHAFASGIGPSWSLTAELCFYAVLPALAYVSWRLMSGRRATGWLALLVGPAVLIVIGLITTQIVHSRVSGLSNRASYALLWGHTGDAVLNGSLLSNADLFGYGMLAAVALEVMRRRGVVALPARTKVLAVLAILLVSATALELGGTFVTNIFGLCAAASLLVVTLPSPRGDANVLARILEWAPFKYVGLISYSVYLWHEPVILFLRSHGWLPTSGVGGLLGSFLIVLAVSVVLASITYRLVEKPAMGLRGRLPSRTVSA